MVRGLSSISLRHSSSPLVRPISMSRKARSPDNARCEGFFGTLKSDFFDGRDWSGVTFEEFSEMLDGYIEWYRAKKLKRSLGWKTIRQHRVELGYAA